MIRRIAAKNANAVLGLRGFSQSRPAGAMIRSRATRATSSSKPVAPKASKTVEAPSPSIDEELIQPMAAAPDELPSMNYSASSNAAELQETEMVSSLEDLEATPEGDIRDHWSTSFAGLGAAPFSDKASDILLAPVEPADVEVTPDGLIYLPEIKYRRILNRAFGPGGWGIAPRTKTLVTNKKVTREYGLVCLGRLVSISRGEMDFFNPAGITTAMEGCKSNALMRCCKDLGIASELWDPSFIRQFKQKYCDQKFFEKKRRFVWKRKDRPWEYPYNT